MKVYKFNESVNIDETLDDIGDILLDLKDIGIEYILTKCWVNPKDLNEEDVWLTPHRTKEIKGYFVAYKISFDKYVKIDNADRQDMIDFLQELKNVEVRLKSFGKVRTETTFHNSSDDYAESELTNTISICILIITDEISNLNQSNEEIINQCIGGYCDSHGLYVGFSTTSNHFWVAASQHMKAFQFNKIAMQIYRDVETLCKGKIKISFDEIGILGTHGNCIRMKIDK